MPRAASLARVARGQGRAGTRVAAALAQLPRCDRVWPSEANFLLVEFADPQRRSQARAAGLLVRDVRRQPGLERSLRLTVGHAATEPAPDRRPGELTQLREVT